MPNTNVTIDKDFLFKTITGTINDELGLNQYQMNTILNILTTSFKDIELNTTKNMLTTNNTSNEIIIKNFVGCKTLAGIAKSSIDQYVLSINKLIEYTKKTLFDTTTNDIRKYLLFYQQSVSKGTADNRRRNLSVFFQFMEDEGYIQKNPCRRIPKIKEDVKYKKFYTDMEIEMMRDACKTKKETALIDLLCSTGMRVSEVSSLKIMDINWEERTILVHGKGSKDRIVPFTIRCKKHLQEYLEERNFYSEYLFCTSRKNHGALCKSSIQQIVKDIGKRVNLIKITVHCFRRWLATDLNRKGMDINSIQDILGHTSFSTTKKHYLDKSIDKKVIAKTGLIFEIPKGWGIQIKNKSGITVKGVPTTSGNNADITVFEGTVDMDYRGELGIMFKNEEDFEITIPKHTKLAQGVLRKVYSCTFVEVDEVNSTVRGNSGFGSTGTNFNK